ncbi:hypothetical protein TrRE_jg7660 [Triparma retinervis]|uniref:LarC family nickel insertion protein n=1 Tax=Triparma retinervis TaxID=2557542 RepID=A0A9W7ATA2_9STRA|nr:hypothetical protein TrRE_jg7660 [Triparma retinervis]
MPQNPPSLNGTFFNNDASEGFDNSLHFDLFSGVAGDMLMSSLLHATLPSVLSIISPLPPYVYHYAALSFLHLAHAEAKTHGVGVDEVHFHEVGAIDSIIDVCGVWCMCYLLKIDPAKISCSALPSSEGTVWTEHGILPVPAPATARLMEGFKVVPGPKTASGELCTPTGVAILRAAVWDPVSMTLDKERTLPSPPPSKIESPFWDTSELLHLRCNLDDVTAEVIGHVSEVLMDSGALDVWTTAITMKKSRSAIEFNVLCEEVDGTRFLEIMFRNTTTLGVRCERVERAALKRTFQEVDTKLGEGKSGVVSVKIGWLGEDAVTIHPEFEHCKRISKDSGIPIKVVMDAARTQVLR